MTPPTSTPKTLTKLKSRDNIPPWTGNSSTLTPTPVPTSTSPRAYYLSNIQLTQAPVISASEFIPESLIRHLMREKKNGALAVKYRPGDSISNMEGALHTFVTPVAKVLMFGDYVFRSGRHGMQRFSGQGGKQVARQVLLGAAVQMDFETRDVMLAVCKLESEELVGELLGVGFEVLGAEEKRDKARRARYDLRLRRHMVAHLTQEARLPARTEVIRSAMDGGEALGFLERFVTSPHSRPDDMVGQFIKMNNARDVISLELLFNTAVHQVRNEISALEGLAPQGYIYTYDPASIFARVVGADLLNRVMLAALKHISSENHFANMRAYAFNDYADKAALRLTEAALEEQDHVRVLRKATLFSGPDDTYDPSSIEGGQDAWLVIHNNSDAFGQNVETEWESGSLDGAVGANSSASASLERKREDLLMYII